MDNWDMIWIMMNMDNHHEGKSWDNHLYDRLIDESLGIIILNNRWKSWDNMENGYGINIG